MNLHVHERLSIPLKDIVLILPVKASAEGHKSRVLLGNGEWVYTTVLSSTLMRRLEGMRKSPVG